MSLLSHPYLKETHGEMFRRHQLNAYNGDISAQNALAFLYKKQGDYENAAFFYEEGARKANQCAIEGLYLVAMDYKNGNRVVKNETRAITLLSKAAEFGSIEAKLELALRDSDGTLTSDINGH